MIGSMPIRAAELIERKRNGEELSAIEISELVLGYTRGEIPDYQLAAWCMAVYFRGLSPRETFSLTEAMIQSGEVLDVGLAIIGQTADLVPADRLLYSLRDVTATVDQLSLIAASIMSKKLAGGAQAIVLDVKVGDGAFMKTLDEARLLAETMIALGREAGREVVC